MVVNISYVNIYHDQFIMVAGGLWSMIIDQLLVDVFLFMVPWLLLVNRVGYMVRDPTAYRMRNTTRISVGKLADWYWMSHVATRLNLWLLSPKHHRVYGLQLLIQHTSEMLYSGLLNGYNGYSTIFVSHVSQCSDPKPTCRYHNTERVAGMGGILSCSLPNSERKAGAIMTSAPFHQPASSHDSDFWVGNFVMWTRTSL